MTETYVSYTPGQSTLLARNGSFLLIATSPTHPVIGQLWTALGTADAAGTALSTLAQQLPSAPFCLIQISGNGAALAARDLATVLDGRPVVADETLAPISIPSYGGILMTATAQDAAGKQQLPFEGGVVAAEALMVVQVGDDVPSTRTPEPAPDPAPDLARVDAPEPAADLAGEDAPEATEEVPALPASPGLWDEVPALDGPTQAPALVEAPAPLGTGPATHQELLEQPAGSPRPDAGALLNAAAPAPPLAATAWGLTCQPSAEVPTVLAGYCLRGHLSPAQEEVCRSCGSAMPPQTPARIERPVLGALILADGRRVELDRDAVLGRAPHAPEGSTPEPHLINLAPFGRDVSRQHAEVVLVDWDVAVRDLGSVNGTRVLHPSGEAVVAEAGALIPLQPGSQIEVAEVTTVVFQHD